MVLAGDKGHPPTISSRRLFTISPPVENQAPQGFAAKEVYHNGYFGAFHIDLRNGAAEIVEWSIDDAHAFACLEGNLHVRCFGLHALEDLRDFFRAQGRGIVAHANKTGDAGRVAYDIPGFFVKIILTST